jgi:hypothetical protein
MKTLASALALAALLALGSSASAATNPPAPFFSAAANSSKAPAKGSAKAGFGDLDGCQGTCTVTCSDDSTHEYYDVTPQACCGYLGSRACPDGAESIVFWPTFSTGGECFAEFCL